ncbi:MAG: universal stress protein [Pseudomonadota bacterium]
MAVKNILVAYNDGESAQNALDIALVMQDKFDAHITGLVARELPSSAGFMNGWIPDAIKQSIRDNEKQKFIELENRWANTVSTRCVPEKTHWIQTAGEANASITTYARYFDMTLLGQADETDADLPSIALPDLVALQSGRPVMVAPKHFDRQPISDRVVLAWDGRRAASRAMADALHFLEEMSLVTILTVGEPNPTEKQLKIDVATHLERHGIRTEYKHIDISQGGHVALGEAIVDYCQKSRPDVLVMGAYEHSKFREDYFGGVTNTVFKDMTIPVFMSH